MSVSSTPVQENPVPENPAPVSPASIYPPAYMAFRRQMIWAAFGIFFISLLVSPVRIRDWPQTLLLIGLILLASFLSLRLPGGKELVTAPIVPLLFAVGGLFGSTAVIIASVLSSAVICFVSIPRSKRRRLDLYVPSVTAHIVAMGGSALVYSLLELLFFPGHGVRVGQESYWYAWAALPFCALLAFIGNALITTTQASLYYKMRWDILWHENFKWMLSSALFMSPVALLTDILYGQHWWLGVGFVLLPVYMMRMAVITHEKTMEAYRHGVELLGRIMQEAHPYTHGHLHRVARWAIRIAEEMSLPAASMQHIGDAAILHDIGKVAVDDRVLNKVGKLTDDDWAMIRRHPVTGADLVTKMSVLGSVGHWIRHHHERPDGKGYPDGLSGEDIPLESSIISVVDAFDAMVGGPAKEDQRPYRMPMAPTDAIAELRRHAGTQFRVDVVETFTSILEREQALEASGLHAIPSLELADDSLWAAPPQNSTRLSLSGQA